MAQVPTALFARLQKSIKQNIIAHDRKAAQLRSQYNSLLPIARIPPEVLLEVFLYQVAMLRKEATSQLPGDDLACQCYSPYYKWLNVSQVCGRWREIALDCTPLWTWLALDLRASWFFPKMVIERSRSFPLDVMINITDPYNHCSPCVDSLDAHYGSESRVLNLLAELLPRIRELVVFIEMDEPDDIWASFDKPADHLEDIRFEAYGGFQFSRETRHQARADPLPTMLFAAETPRIHSLAVVGFAFELTNSLLHPGLRHLEITSCLCGTAVERSNLREFLVALRALPHLDTLKVDWSMTAVEEDSFEPVHLRELKLLHLAADPIPSKLFLNHLRFPHSAAVRYKSPNTLLTHQELEVIAQFSVSLLDGMTPRAIWYGPVWPHPERKPLSDPNASCHIWVADKHASVAGTPLESPWTTLPPPQPRLAVESHDPMFIDAVVSSALHALDLTAVHAICLEDFAVGNKWARVLGKANGVTTLRALGGAAFGLPAALARGVPKDIAPWDEDGLESNEWHWVDFAEDAREVVSEETEEHTPAPLDEGEDAATQTQDKGGDDSNEPIPPLFPQLNTIVFIGVDFAAPEGTKTSLHPDVRIPSSLLSEFQVMNARYGFSLAAFCKCLQVRRAQGASDLVRVEFEECRGAGVAQLAALIEEGVEVWWNHERVCG
ncbi:hypothetical protein TRAPUB_7381 [Trametes pubescens]|uniref:F-box domain-containing protein n=1 Tax=Trametes pubescens TaxID=154538 RepID=A0A1M2W6Z4_TRAPU|nr:hypothetical protein TRAPUB_7381 [Trametes pubescens]